MVLTLLLALAAQDLPSRSLPAHAQKTRQVRFVPDGQLILTLGDPDRSVKVWRSDGSKLLFTLSAQATCFDIRPEGGLVAIGSDQDAGVWSLVTGDRTEVLDVPRCVALGWSRDGKTLTTVSVQRGGGKPGGLVARAGKASIFIPLPRDPAWIAVSPDGLRVAVPADASVRVWDVEADRVAFELPGRASAFAFSPDGKTMATAGNQVVRLWDGAKELRTLEAVYETAPSLAFASGGARLLVGAETGLEMWDLGGRRLATYAGPGTGVWFPASMAVSPDGRLLAAGGTLILKDAPASGRVAGPIHFWKLRP